MDALACIQLTILLQWLRVVAQSRYHLALGNTPDDE
jgi:hypothetical protein